MIAKTNQTLREFIEERERLNDCQDGIKRMSGSIKGMQIDVVCWR